MKKFNTIAVALIIATAASSYAQASTGPIGANSTKPQGISGHFKGMPGHQTERAKNKGVMFTPASDLNANGKMHGVYNASQGTALIFSHGFKFSKSKKGQGLGKFYRFTDVVTTAPSAESKAVLIGSYVDTTSGATINLYGIKKSKPEAVQPAEIENPVTA